MGMSGKILSISVSILLLAGGEAAAGWFGADFSAEIYQRNAQQQVQQGRMYVSHGRVRTEIEVNGDTYVEIIDPHQGMAWMLDAGNRQYRERVVPNAAEKHRSTSNPCAAMPQARCQHLGSDTVNGRSSDKWQVVVSNDTLLHWMDSQHHFPVRVVRDGKLTMEMRFLGHEQYGSRRVEKWQSWSLAPQGGVRVTQWYDPQLNIALRQQLADGQLRELRNIRLGEQPEVLFSVPEGYVRATE
jgi:hypothetical protein